MYPSSLIHCYKYLLFTWRDDIKMLHSMGFGSLTACPLFFQGTSPSFAFIYSALKEVTPPPPHTPLFLLPLTPPIYDLYTLLLSLSTIHLLFHTSPIHMSVLCPKPLSFVLCLVVYFCVSCRFYN